MSFEGIGALIAGAFIIAVAGPVIVAGTAALLAGGATYLVVKGGVSAGKALYRAFVSGQAERQARVRRDLSQVQGSLGEAAREQQKAMERILEKGNQACEEAIRERERQMEDAQRRLEKVRDPGRAEEMLTAMLRQSAQAVDSVVRAEVSGFEDSLRKGCEEAGRQAAERVRAGKEAFAADIARVQRSLDEKNERCRQYAESIRDEGDKLLRALRANYDCERFALPALRDAEATSGELARLIREGNYKAATGVAADYEAQLMELQASVQMSTALYEQRRLSIDIALKELEAVCEAAERFQEDVPAELTAQDGPLEGYVTPERGADYWSGGRMGPLLAKAARLKEEAASAFEDGRNIPEFVAEIRRQAEMIRYEHAKARALLANRVAVGEAAGKVVESMEENGWYLDGDAAYRGGDLRGDLVLTFSDDGGDRRTVVIRTEFDEMTGKYMIRIVRYAFEKGIPDEDERKRQDDALNASLEARGVTGAAVGCNRKTLGVSKRPGEDGMP